MDFIAVTERDLADVEVRSLQDLHRGVYDLDTEWAKHLEGSYFPKAVLATTKRRGMPLWYLDHGARSLALSGHCNTVVVRWVVGHHAVRLRGPERTDLIGPIPVAEMRREIFATIQDWGRDILEHPERFNNRFYQGFIVVNYCRMLHDLFSGDVGSKRAGSLWASVELDPIWRPLIDRAWRCRPDPATSVRQSADGEDFRRTLEFVQYCVEYSRIMRQDDRQPNRLED